jgi:S1-C subfamily serine protease
MLINERNTVATVFSVACLIGVVLFLAGGRLAFAGKTYENHVVKVNVLTVDRKGNVGMGHGTGFVINDEGHIVTNWHVVNNAAAIFVLRDGQRIDAMQGFDVANKFVGTNVEDNPWTSKDLDLAILKVKPEYWNQLNLEPVTLANQRPLQGSIVATQGYPGIADQTAVKSQDITAYSTYAAHNLARIIEGGRWSGTEQNIVQLLHTIPTSGGNSGGPVFDECGRVVGVHSASPTETARLFDSKGRQLDAMGVVSNAAYGLASDISELIRVLDSKGIKYFLDESVCYSKQDLYEEENRKLSKILQFSLYFGGAALVIIGIILVHLLRSPAARQQISHAVESYSRSLRASRPQSKSPSAGAVRSSQPAATVLDAPKINLILDGYGANRQRYRLVISGDQLYRGDVVVGRSPDDSAYAVNEDSISRRHCAFYAQGNNLYVRDINSTNGTFVNGRQLSSGESVPLENGAEVRLGGVKFKVISG